MHDKQDISPLFAIYMSRGLIVKPNTFPIMENIKPIWSRHGWMCHEKMGGNGFTTKSIEGGRTMDEIIKMLKKYEPDFREMDAGEIKTIVEVLDAFISDYRSEGWDDIAIGYGK